MLHIECSMRCMCVFCARVHIVNNRTRGPEPYFKRVIKGIHLLKRCISHHLAGYSKKGS